MKKFLKECNKLRLGGFLRNSYSEELRRLPEEIYNILSRDTICFFICAKKIHGIVYECIYCWNDSHFLLFYVDKKNQIKHILIKRNDGRFEKKKMQGTFSKFHRDLFMSICGSSKVEEHQKFDGTILRYKIEEFWPKQKIRTLFLHG